MNKIFFLLLAFLFVGQLHGQTPNRKLANQYYNMGEYEKAAVLYEKLWKASKRKQKHYYDRYFSSLIESEQFDAAKQSIDRRIEAESKNVALLVKKAAILVAQGHPEQADLIYQRAIENLPTDHGQIARLGQEFQSGRNYKLAIATYEKGAKLLNDSIRYAPQLRVLSQYQNDKPRLIRYSLLTLIKYEQNAPTVRTQLQRSLAKEDYAQLEELLYVYIQNYPNKIVFPELLQWSYVQRRQFALALRQARALDRQLEENGKRVFDIGSMAANHKDYNTAIQAFKYIVDKKSKNGSFYLAAKSEILRARKNQVLDRKGGIPALDSLEQEYFIFLADYGKTANAAYVILDLARFQNRYLKNSDKAIATLVELVAMPGVKKQVLANAKLELGDLYLLKGDRWEATLLYSQVDKDFPEENLGEEARYRNALLSYYVGDFEWAQQQFDILKASTTKLISNDAIDRSVFILDNLGLDTTAAPLMKYSDAELKLFQRRYDEAFSQLTELLQMYPEHGLEDDVLYLQANSFVDLARYTEAAELYSRVASEFADDIRADNSIYALAQLNENVFNDLPMATKLYEKLFIDYKDSTFAIESRKKYRELIKNLPESDLIKLEEMSDEELFMRGLKRIN